jgi:phenylacetate-coenzyme A ligase PaaK-like adenylate-forming protein
LSEAITAAAPRFPSLAAGPELVRLLARRRKGIDAVRSYQLDVIRRIVEHAAATVPLYQELYPGDLGAKLGSIADFGALPIIDKQTFLARPEPERRTLLTYDGETRVTTSGTTGQAFTVHKTPYTSWKNWVNSLLMMRAMGIRVRDDQVSVSHRPRRKKQGAVRWIAGSRLRLDPMLTASELASRLIDIQPDWLTGHPHQLVEIGWHLENKLRPATVTTFGVTTGEEERAAITEAYGCVPIDIFGTVETSFFAWQCRYRDLWHISHELVYMEILDENGSEVPAGELGHMVLTSLTNPAMPFIRYRVGDSASFADRPCKCGHSLPALERIQGRTFDWLVDCEGGRVAPQRLQFAWVLKIQGAITGLRRYRVHQNSDGTVLVEIVSGPGFDQSIPKAIESSYEKLLGAAVEVRLVDQIPLEKTGKFRQFTSDRRAEGFAELH